MLRTIRSMLHDDGQKEDAKVLQKLAVGLLESIDIKNSSVANCKASTKTNGRQLAKLREKLSPEDQEAMDKLHNPVPVRREEVGEADEISRVVIHQPQSIFGNSAADSLT